MDSVDGGEGIVSRHARSSSSSSSSSGGGGGGGGGGGVSLPGGSGLVQSLEEQQCMDILEQIEATELAGLLKAQRDGTLSQFVSGIVQQQKREERSKRQSAAFVVGGGSVDSGGGGSGEEERASSTSLSARGASVSSVNNDDLQLQGDQDGRDRRSTSSSWAVGSGFGGGRTSSLDPPPTPPSLFSSPSLPCRHSGPPEDVEQRHSDVKVINIGQQMLQRYMKRYEAKVLEELQEQQKLPTSPPSPAAGAGAPLLETDTAAAASEIGSSSKSSSSSSSALISSPPPREEDSGTGAGAGTSTSDDFLTSYLDNASVGAAAINSGDKSAAAGGEGRRPGSLKIPRARPDSLKRRTSNLSPQVERELLEEIRVSIHRCDVLQDIKSQEKAPGAENIRPKSAVIASKLAAFSKHDNSTLPPFFRRRKLTRDTTGTMPRTGSNASAQSVDRSSTLSDISTAGSIGLSAAADMQQEPEWRARPVAQQHQCTGAVAVEAKETAKKPERSRKRDAFKRILGLGPKDEPAAEKREKPQTPPEVSAPKDPDSARAANAGVSAAARQFEAKALATKAQTGALPQYLRSNRKW